VSETLSGFAAVAIMGFVFAFGALLLFMALVQPIWCVVDCAVDAKRSTGSKVVWILALLLLWGVANWFYGAFAATARALRRLTRLAWILIIVLVAAFFALFYSHAEFRRGIEREWQKRPELTVQLAPLAEDARLNR
jgi:hypothetical protein